MVASMYFLSASSPFKAVVRVVAWAKLAADPFAKALPCPSGSTQIW